MFFFTFCIFGRHVESIILCWRNDNFFYHAGKKVWKCLLIQEIQCPNGLEASFLNSAASTWEFLNGTPLEASRPLPTIFFGSSMGFVFLGKRDWLPFVQVFFLLGMCKHNIIFYQHNIKLMFAHVDNMCKRSNTFHERNIKLVFAHVNSMCKSSSICFSMVACHRTLLFHPTPLHL